MSYQPFTDDDLNELKQLMANNQDGTDDPQRYKWRALLARLEAAEAVLKRSAPTHLGGCDRVELGRKCDCGSDQIYNTWRKAAGK